MTNKKISILIIGLEHEYSLESFYKEAFNLLGIKKIYHFSNRIYFYLFCKLNRMKVKFLFQLVRLIFENRIFSFLKKIKPIDLIIIFKGIEINKNFLIKLKNIYPATKIINIYTDDPFNLNEVSTSSNLVLDSIPAYDFFFIWSKKIKKKLEKKYKFNKIFHYLPFGYNKRVPSIKKKKLI